MCKFPIYLHFIICSVSHYVQVPYLFTFHYMFSVPFWASSLSIYIPLDLQCPILGKFPIYLHFIISLVSHLGQVPYLFTFHQIFSVPSCASSLTSYVSLYLQCPILGKYPIVLHFIISSVSHYVQVLHIFTFHSIFSVPFCASSLTSYVSLYLQCPIVGKYPIILCFIIYLVSHYVQVPYLFTFHQIFSVPLCASSPIFLHFIISLVSHFGQVPYLFTFHQIFSVPLCACSLSFYLSLYPLVSHYVQVPYLFTFHYIQFYVSVSHYVQVLHIFTFHSIFSVPFCASSLTSYVSLYLQCPILGKYPIIYLYCASLYIQCPIMCKFPIFLPFIISFVYHYVQVLLLFTFHYMFSVPLWASSLSIYISLYLQCPILGKFPIYLHSIRSSVSHSGQVPYSFCAFHYIFSFPLCASSLSFYVSLYPLCPIMCKYPIFLHFIISSQCPIFIISSVQVPYLFTFHYIFSVPFGASSLSFYLSLYLQFPILMCQFPPFDTFHYIFSVPFWASTLQFYVSLYLQCPIMSKYPIILCFIIYLVSHYVQVLHLFTFHYIFSVPFWASTLQLYVSLFLQCPIMCMFPIFLRFVIYLVSHYVQVPYHFMFHYIFSVPLCASSLLLLHFIIFLMVSLLASTLSLRLIISFACHYVQVPYLFTFHHIFSVPFWASSLSIYISLYLQCLIMCKFTIFLCFIIYLVSHYVQVPYNFMFHYIFSVPFCASSLTSYFRYIFSVPFWASIFCASLYIQCPIMCKFPIFLPFIISLVSHSYVLVPSF